jgi:hypothetical protein
MLNFVYEDDIKIRNKYFGWYRDFISVQGNDQQASQVS